MNDFKTKLSKERTDLENKIENLNTFLVKIRDDRKSVSITDYHLAMLNLQLNSMSSYLMILNMRINDLKLEGVEKVLKGDVSELDDLKLKHQLLQSDNDSKKRLIATMSENLRTDGVVGSKLTDASKEALKHESLKRDKEVAFIRAIATAINEHGIDNYLNVPDYILADWLNNQLQELGNLRGKIRYHEGDGTGKEIES